MKKKDLEQIRILNDKINDKITRISEMKSRLLPGAIRYGEASRGSPRGMADAFARIEEEERKLNEMIDLLFDAKEEAKQAIYKITNKTARAVIFLRYVNLSSWLYIASALNISRRTAFNYRDIGLRELQDIDVK